MPNSILLKTYFGRIEVIVVTNSHQLYAVYKCVTKKKRIGISSVVRLQCSTHQHCSTLQFTHLENVRPIENINSKMFVTRINYLPSTLLLFSIL